MADEFKIVASLNIPESASRINKDIPKLEGQVKHLKIVADLNPTLSIKNIQATLNKMNNNANIKIGIDTSGLNSVQGVTQNITNNLKSVQTQAQQTASAVRDIGNVGISDNVFKKLLQDMQISKSVTNEYKQSLRALANELTTAWDTRNEELYLAKLKEIINVIGNGQKSFKLFDKDSFDFKEITSQITALKSAIGVGVDGNGRKNKFFIDDNLKKELAYIQGSDKAVRSLLNSLYGLGNWTFDERKFGFTNLRSQIDKASASADSLYAKFSNANFGGGNIANFITETAGQIDTLKAKLNTKDTLNGFLQLEMGIANADKQLEIMIADALKLKDFTSRRNDPLCWFEEIQTETQGLKEETAVIKEQTRATKELSAIRESVTRDAFGQQMSRTSVYGNAGYTRVSRYNENDELTSFTDTENYQKLEQQLAKIEEVRAKYNRLLADFKSSNSAIQSGLTQPIEQFEKVLNSLGKTSSINDVKNAFESLKQSASEITAYLDTTNSSFNKATNAVNNYKNMDNILKDMTASFDNLIVKPENMGKELDDVKAKLKSLQEIEKSEGFTENWAKQYREVNLEITRIRNNIKLAEQASKTNASEETKIQLQYLGELNKAYQQLISNKNKLASATNEDTKNAYTDEVKKSELLINNLTEEFNATGLVTKEIQNQIDVLKEKVALTDRINTNKANDKIQSDNLKAQEQAIRNYISLYDECETKISNTITKLNSLNNSTIFSKNASNPQVVKIKQDIADILSEYQKLSSALETTHTSEGLNKINEDLIKLNARFNTTTATAKQFETELRNDNGAEKLAQRVALLKAQLEALAKANPKAMKRFGNEINSLMATLNNSPDARAVDQVAKSVQLLRREINNADLAGKTFWQTFEEKSKKFIGWMSMTFLYSSMFRAFRSAITNVVELDKAMTNLKKVTDETDATYSKFLNNASSQAKELHSTITDIVEQTAVWAKLGYSLQEAQNLATTSMIYSKVGEVENSKSVSDLVTVMKAFNIESSKSITIVDALNELGNSFATSAADLGEGLTKSASALQVANNSFEQSIALLTGGTEITQNANEMGSALKVISMRIRGMKGELEALGEEYDNIESISKIQTQILNLTKGKVNIFDDNGNFRATYDILKDISDVYNDLSDPAKADITEILFGKMRGNQGVALIQAFQSGQIQKAYETALNSAGSAQKEFDSWSKSIEAHIETFKASFESLSKSLIKDNFLIGLVDSGTKLIDILDKIINDFGVIPTLIGGSALFAGLKNVGELLNTPSYALLQLCA